MTTAAESLATVRPWYAAYAVVLVQIVGYLTAVVVLANEPLGFDPWPVVLAVGVLGAQIYLTSLAAAWGPWPIFRRLAISAALVIGGTIALAIGASEGRVNAPDLLEGLTFVVLIWIANQVPLWILKPLLGVRIVPPGQACEGGRPAQFRIRQLMVLTLAVAVAIGIGRLLFPASVWENWGRDLVNDWLLIGLLLVAVTLVGATAAATALHPQYWRSGLVFSAVSSVLVACGLYSLLHILKVAPGDRLPFAVMIVAIYAWLEASLLLAHWSGYRSSASGMALATGSRAGDAPKPAASALPLTADQSTAERDVYLGNE